MIQVFDKYGNLKVLESTGATIENDPLWAAWLAGPPNLSEFNNDVGYITGGPFLPLAGGTMDLGSHIYFGTGGQNIAQGTFDNGTGGNQGISLTCAVGYELNWQGGWLQNWDGAFAVPIRMRSPFSFTMGSYLSSGDDAISVSPDTRQLYATDGSTAVIEWNTSAILNGLTYPTSDGSAGDVITTDGAGNLSFTTIVTSETDPVFTAWLAGPPNVSEFTNDAGYLTTTGITPATLTKTDDTNVTLTLGGTPATALLQGVSLTLGWTGTLADARIASAATWNAKQAALSGTGFVKSTAGVISYDTSTYLTTSSASSTYVPYTGATANIDLNSRSIGFGTTTGTGRINLPDAGTTSSDGIHFGTTGYIFRVSSTVVRYSGSSFNMDSNLSIQQGAQIFNNTLAANGSINFNSAGLIIGRNTADSANALRIQQSNASSTGNILQMENSGGAVSVFSQLGYLGIGITSSLNAKLDIKTDSIGITQTDAGGIYLENTTASTVGLQQYSPALTLVGSGWSTNLGNAGVSKLRISNQPIQKTNANYGYNFYVEKSVNAGAYAEVFSIGNNVAGGNGSYLSMEGTKLLSSAGAWIVPSGGAITFTSASLAGSFGTITNSTGAWTITPIALSGSGATTGFDMSQTWNTSGTPTFLKVNITDTASNVASVLMDLQVGGSSKFSVNKSGNVVAGGSISSTAASIVSGTFFSAAVASYYTWTGRARIYSPADGVIGLYNAAVTDFTRLQFGGTTSSFPSIKRNSTALNFRLADDSADAGITASTATFSGDVTHSDATNIILGTTTGTKIGTATTQKLGFWNATPLVQQTTASAAATFVANTSGIANDTATFDGYTLGQIVKVLRNLGILA